MRCFPHSLSAADLGVVMLDERVGRGSVPSKAYNLMSFGIPALYVAGLDSQLARYAEEFGHARCFQGDQVDEIAHWIGELASNPDKLKEMGQRAERPRKDSGATTRTGFRIVSRFRNGKCMKQTVLDNLKNLRGWRTPRKLVAFAVDDYANVRVDSREALERLNGAGLDLSSPFDHLDTVETRQDLEALFEVLDSVRDGRGRPAIFTAYAMSANPDFGRILESGEKYHYETVSDTFSRLSSEQAAAYDGAWALWQEGMAKGLIQPQFHGREHLNIDLFEHKLRQKSPDVMANLKTRVSPESQVIQPCLAWALRTLSA